MDVQKTKFLKISCPRCHNKQIIFGNSSFKVKCQVCNKLLIKTTGGKTKIKAKVEKVLPNSYNSNV